ncbi:unnamed protein product [Effrenium voratum]|uniref:MBD domain-containing protein n=1 Tax=Effrenium voratum TaxID=2562239 RepID=A0AA36NDD8_9DINO|nr:unnamed protein product [Effrenium voratum]
MSRRPLHEQNLQEIARAPASSEASGQLISFSAGAPGFSAPRPAVPYRGLLARWRQGAQAFWWHGLARPVPCQDAKRPRLDDVAALAKYLAQRGKHVQLQGWTARTEVRKTGNSAGHADLYWFSETGRRFRSMAEVARHFGLEEPRK